MPAKTPRRAAPVSSDVLAVLEQHPQAQAARSALPPSRCRADDDWIKVANCGETWLRRLVQAVPRLAGPRAANRRASALVATLVWAGVGGSVSRAAEAAASDRLTAAVALMQAAVRSEVEAGNVTGVSVALVVEDLETRAFGHGWADRERQKAATAGTVYRVGSISKLFTAVAAMQCVEAGAIDLDQPAARWVPEFRMVNPFPDAPPPTLRQLLCHRSGLVREAPVGGYFDGSEPTARDTVASLEGCVLVYPPNTRTKYSNSGLTVVGRAVEEATRQDFAAYQAERLLGPLGMTDSGFLLGRALKSRLARGYLPVAERDGGFREIVAPQFEFGILPAGNLYSTAEDLGRFLKALLVASPRSTEEATPLRGLGIRRGTLEAMWTVQLQGPEVTNGFGLGFSLGHYRGRRTIGHMGAVYGFTSSVLAIPGDGVGVVVLANDDLAVAAVRRLARRGLDVLLEQCRGMAAAERREAPTAMKAEELAACAGAFESESFWAQIESGEGDDGLTMTLSRQRLRLSPDGPWRFRANGRLSDDAEVQFERGPDGAVVGFTGFGQTFRRVSAGEGVSVPEVWRRYVGAYGPAFIPLRVSIRNGHLYAMTENEYDYRLRPLNRTVFQMPPGLYEGEHLVFQRNRSGRVYGVLLANMPLRRRGE